MSRYTQLDNLIAVARPFRILEVGAWNGARAIQMLTEALKYRPVVDYTGLDLFEEATDETDAAESNVKRHVPLADVTNTLAAFCADKPARFTLIKGNTRATLTGRMFYPDFVWLDGGHSIETIDSDYAALQHARLVVLDDYYTLDENGCGIDTERFGCNQLVARLQSMHGTRVEILPIKDKVRGGGYVQAVAVWR